MEITSIDVIPKPVAIYFDSNNCINQKFNNVNLNKIRSQASELTNKYLPILNILDIRDDKLTFQNQDIVNERYVTNSEQYVHKGNQLGCTASDLILNTPEFLYNLSDTAVTVRGRSNIPKHFLPNVNPVIQQTHKGFLLFFRVFYLNSIDFIHRNTGVENYLKDLNEQAKTKNNAKLQELIDVTQYVIDFIESQDTDFATVSASSTIKVVTVAAVSMDKLKGVKQSNGELCKNFIIDNRDLVLTIGSYKDVPDHQGLNINYQVSAEMSDKYKAGIIKIFIVDKKPLLSARYISLAGKVIEIPKIKNTELRDGLYLLSSDAKGNIHDNQYISDNCYVSTLEDINNVKYIYDNHEAALKGADRIKEYNDQLYIQKTEVDILLNKSRLEYDQKDKEQKLNFDKQAHEAKISHEKEIATLKAEYESSSYKRKDVYESRGYDRKDYYETRRYERDDTIEKIKTVGAIAGLVAGGYVLFKKFG